MRTNVTWPRALGCAVLAEHRGILIPTAHCEFVPWQGRRPRALRRWGNKPLVRWCGRPYFAEVALVRMMLRQGWESAWVDNWTRSYWSDMPGRVASRCLPARAQFALERLWTATGGRGGTWDVLAWKGDQVRFIESKGPGDRFKSAQGAFCRAACKRYGRGSSLLVMWRA